MFCLSVVFLIIIGQYYENNTTLGVFPEELLINEVFCKQLIKHKIRTIRFQVESLIVLQE